MSKVLAAVAFAIAGLAAPADAALGAVLGPHQASCAAGAARPAMLVRVSGLRSRTGLVRVQSYADPSRFFEKKAWLERIDVPVPARGTIEICMPVPRSGVYAVSVRHDANGSGKADMRDGGGMSGNPALSLTDVMFRRKPAPASVAVRVGGGVADVPIVMNYVQGARFAPVKTAVN